MFGFLKRQPSSDTPKPSAVSIKMGRSGLSGEYEVAGTTTFAQESVEALCERHGLTGRAMIELSATIQPEPDNPHDPDAVAVVVEGEKVGNLHHFIAKEAGLRPGTAETVRYQLSVLREDGQKFQGKAFVWAGKGSPHWSYSEARPVPLLLAERAQESHERNLAAAATLYGPDTPVGRALRSGNAAGLTPLEMLEPIKALKREKRWEDALLLLNAAMDGEEAAFWKTRTSPSPWFFEHAAIVCRRLKLRDEEIAALERYLGMIDPDYREGHPFKERLDKLRDSE